MGFGKLFSFILLFAISFFLITPKFTFAQDDIGKKLKDTYQCGEIGQKCCKKEITLEKFKLPTPDIPVLGTVIDILASPLNAMISLVADPVIDWTQDKTASILGRPPCAEGVPSDIRSRDRCTCLNPENFQLERLCTAINDASERNRCVDCHKHGIWTAVGCIDFKFGKFVADIFGVGVGLAGGVAFLCIMYSAFILQTSQGNAERLKRGREYLTNCIIGLILILFSIFILRVIGVNILAIPGFS